MKKTIMNFEIENVLNILNDKNSFRNDLSVKLPKAVRQALRINMDTLSNRLKVFDEERKEVYNRFIQEGKTDKTDDGNYKVRDEFLPELNQELVELAVVQNELELEELNMDVFDNVDLSMQEEDALKFMTNDEVTKKVGTDENTAPVEENANMLRLG